MTRRTISNLVRVGLLLAIACGSLAMFAVKRSEAANGQCVPTIVEYLPGQVMVQCNGTTNFWGMVSPPSGCGSFAQNVETLKSWLSLGQAGLLSGKNVNLYHTACGGLNLLTGMDLIR